MSAPTQTVLITGGSRGIGAACARQLAAAGWAVAVNYTHDAAAANAVVGAITQAGGRAIAVQADVSDEGQVLAMFARVRAELPPLAGLVNNAGVIDVSARLQDMSVARWRRMLDINVIGSLLCAREAVKAMSTQQGENGGGKGGGKGGAIVNIGSAASRIGSPNMYVDYAATKGAIDTFTLGLSKEVAADGIRVNAVRPGIIDTEIHGSGGLPDRAQAAAPQIPLQRPGTADEVAAAVVWLLSPAASYTTGAILDVTGGR